MSKEIEKSKKLYTFVVEKEITKDVEEKTTNEAGETVITIKKETTSEPNYFYLAKPTRKLFDREELLRSSKFSEAVRDYGLIPEALLRKRIMNDSGTFSDSERELYHSLREETVNLLKDKQKLDATTEKTEEQKKEYGNIVSRIESNFRSLRDFESSHLQIFDNTAEAFSRKFIIRWWTLNLSYKDDGTPLFPGKNDEEKLENYYKLSDSADEFQISVLMKFIIATNLWFANNFVDQKQFEDAIKEISSE